MGHERVIAFQVVPGARVLSASALCWPGAYPKATRARSTDLVCNSARCPAIAAVCLARTRWRSRTRALGQTSDGGVAFQLGDGYYRLSHGTLVLPQPHEPSPPGGRATAAHTGGQHRHESGLRDVWSLARCAVCGVAPRVHLPLSPAAPVTS